MQGQFLLNALLCGSTWLPALLIMFIPSRLLGAALSMLAILGISWLGPQVLGHDWLYGGYWIGGFAGGTAPIAWDARGKN